MENSSPDSTTLLSALRRDMFYLPPWKSSLSPLFKTALTITLAFQDSSADPQISSQGILIQRHFSCLSSSSPVTTFPLRHLFIHLSAWSLYLRTRAYTLLQHGCQHHLITGTRFSDSLLFHTKSTKCLGRQTDARWLKRMLVVQNPLPRS